MGDVREYLDLEDALSDKLLKAWAPQASKLYAKIATLVGRGQWADAYEMAKQIDFTDLARKHASHIRYVLAETAMFGAKQVSKRPILSVSSMPVLKPVVQNFIRTLELNATTYTYESLVQSIAQAEVAATAELVQKANPYRDEQGQFTTKDKDVSGFSEKGPLDLFMDAQGKEKFRGEQEKRQEKLTAEQVTALKEYVMGHAGVGYRRINQGLRKGSFDSDERSDQIKQVVSQLDAAFDTVSPIPEDIVVYRGVPEKVGLGTDAAYMSTSMSQLSAASFGTVYKFVVPKGTKVLLLDKYGRQGEDELLLPRGQTLTKTGGEDKGMFGKVYQARLTSEVQKANPYRDAEGQYTTKDKAVTTDSAFDLDTAYKQLEEASLAKSLGTYRKDARMTRLGFEVMPEGERDKHSEMEHSFFSKEKGRSIGVIDLPRKVIQDEVTVSYVKTLLKEKKFQPIKVTEVNGEYVVLDGHHRLVAAKLLGHGKIAAVLIEQEVKKAEEVQKANPYKDAEGRFTTKDKAVTTSRPSKLVSMSASDDLSVANNWASHSDEEWALVTDVVQKTLKELQEKNPDLSMDGITLVRKYPQGTASGMAFLHKTGKTEIVVSPWNEDALLVGGESEEKRLKAGLSRWTVGSEAQIELNQKEAIRITFIHELGHALENKAEKERNGPLFDQYRREMFDEVHKQGGKEWLRKNVSGYAAVNPVEAMAEIFTMVHAVPYKKGTLPEKVEKMAYDLIKFSSKAHNEPYRKKAEGDWTVLTDPVLSYEQMEKLEKRIDKGEEITQADLRKMQAAKSDLPPLTPTVVESKAFQAVLKKEKQRFVREFVSFQKDGDDMLKLISSLNSSRVAAWGFLMEAAYVGAEEYELTAVLDGRTSEFCRMINGKRFKVANGETTINEVLSVENPDDLKVVQPWPKQTKAAMAEWREMSASELTERNLHLPPFHPGCRTLLSLVGKAPPLKKPPVENPPVPEELSGVEDFEAVGVKLSEAQVGFWNSYIGLNPAQVLSMISGKTPMEILGGAITGKYPKIAIGKMGTVSMKAKGALHNGTFDVGVAYDPFTGTIAKNYVELFKVTRPQAAVFLKQLELDLIDMGLAVGATTIAVPVSSGSAFAFAKLGVVPGATDWFTIRKSIAASLAPGGKNRAMFAQLEKRHQIVIEKILSQNHEDGMMVLANLNITVNGKPVGRILLEGQAYKASLDLTDSDKVAALKEILL